VNRFLTRIPFIDPEDIMYPPSSGWPNITAERFALLGKTDTVVDLLKHLPYIRNHGKAQSHRPVYGTCIDSETFVLNYTDQDFQKVPLDMEQMEYRLSDYGEGPQVPSYVAVWTEQVSPIVGRQFLIDTMDGTFS
jgi:hypothetical protein